MGFSLEIRDPEKFSLVKERISALLSFDSSQYSNSFLGRRVEVRMRALDLRSYEEYALLLHRDREEQERLRKELTIHTTNFFRDKEMWRVFREEVLPTILRLKRAGSEKRLRLWSAGCSTGEEPLTIAICLYEALGRRLANLDVSILATDIDPFTIARAREARYEEEQFREMEESLRDRYFTRDEEGYWHPIPDLMKLIYYRVGDLHSPLKPKEMDAIFCRNTVIYFDQHSKRRLYEEMFESLNPGGFFIMGKTETLFGSARERFQNFNVHERIHCKE